MSPRVSLVLLGLLASLALMFAACVPPPAAAPTTAPQPTTAPPNAPAAQELTVFAAASLTAAFKEIGQEFEAGHPGAKVAFNFAGSQALSTQLKEGARADVFASANAAEMENVQKVGLADDTDEVFVTNRLVVIVPADNPGKIENLMDLGKPGVKLVVADTAVPVGGYTLSMLEKMSADADYGGDFDSAVLENVVSQENNVKAVVAKVALGEGDAGVVYFSDVAPDVAPKVRTLTVPDEFNQIARYPIVALKGAAQPDLAQEFVAFVLAPVGQAILEKWNFVPVK